METKHLSDETLLSIHRAIHNRSVNSLEIEGKNYPIEISQSNGCRHLLYPGINFMEQNKAKESPWAKRARNGELITWGIRYATKANPNAPWIRIINDKIEAR